MGFLLRAVALAIFAALVVAALYMALTRPCHSGLHRHRHWRRSSRHDQL